MFNLYEEENLYRIYAASDAIPEDEYPEEKPFEWRDTIDFGQEYDSLLGQEKVFLDKLLYIKHHLIDMRPKAARDAERRYASGVAKTLNEVNNVAAQQPVQNTNRNVTALYLIENMKCYLVKEENDNFSIYKDDFP